MKQWYRAWWILIPDYLPLTGPRVLSKQVRLGLSCWVRTSTHQNCFIWATDHQVCAKFYIIFLNNYKISQTFCIQNIYFLDFFISHLCVQVYILHKIGEMLPTNMRSFWQSYSMILNVAESYSNDALCCSIMRFLHFSYEGHIFYLCIRILYAKLFVTLCIYEFSKQKFSSTHVCLFLLSVYIH